MIVARRYDTLTLMLVIIPSSRCWRRPRTRFIIFWTIDDFGLTIEATVLCRVILRFWKPRHSYYFLMPSYSFRHCFHSNIFSFYRKDSLSYFPILITLELYRWTSQILYRYLSLLSFLGCLHLFCLLHLMSNDNFLSLFFLVALPFRGYSRGTQYSLHCSLWVCSGYRLPPIYPFASGWAVLALGYDSGQKYLSPLCP